MTKRLAACRFCGHTGTGYRSEPESVVDWHIWADRMNRTHRQQPCPHCQKLTIWVKK